MSEENTAPTPAGEEGERDEIDLADLAARLKERVDAIRKTRAFLNENGPALRMHDDLLMASRALLSSPRVEREWCLNCGTVTRDHRCHCTEIGQEPNFVNYADELARQMNAAASSPREERGEVVESARRIVAWDDNGRLADDEWLVERNETAIIAICRALLSSPDARREALEEAAKVADEMAVNRARVSGVAEHACKSIAARIRALKETKP